MLLGEWHMLTRPQRLIPGGINLLPLGVEAKWRTLLTSKANKSSLEEKKLVLRCWEDEWSSHALIPLELLGPI